MDSTVGSPILRLLIDGRVYGKWIPDIREIAEDCAGKTFWRDPDNRKWHTPDRHRLSRNVRIRPHSRPIGITQDGERGWLVVFASRKHPAQNRLNPENRKIIVRDGIRQP